METAREKASIESCYHCGESCDSARLEKDDHRFCCDGCMFVYELLRENNMCDYYSIENSPGSNLKGRQNLRYEYLDDASVKIQVQDFSDGKTGTVTFSIPGIHCSSCIWLLENLYRLHPGILKSRVNFLRREVFITFNEELITLRKLAELLASIHYPPELTLDDLNRKEKPHFLRPYYYKLAIAFFCFGNIMMLSFPEYLGLDILAESSFRKYFGYLNFVLSLPVLFFSASEFFRSAYTALKQNLVNMDFPIVLGIIVMFIRSSWEIFSGHGAGYMDTLASLILLMLIGRLFQQKVYHRLSFDRDYKSYFPVAVTVIKNGIEKSTPVTDLKKGDRIIIRHQELIPADSILFSGAANIDYSFVTGESVPVDKTLGEIVYAGGRQLGGVIELEIVKEVSHSYLTRLWNDQIFKEEPTHDLTTLANRVSKKFTLIVIGIALGAGLYWAGTDSMKAINAFTAVLIITCPCALALSSPFTLGSLMRNYNKVKLYLRNGPVAEKLAKADTIVFDKTGTLTRADGAVVKFSGDELTVFEQQMIKSLARQLNHPIGKLIAETIPAIPALETEFFKEHPGKGAEAEFNGHHLVAGTLKMFPGMIPLDGKISATRIYININGRLKGHYEIRNQYRTGFEELINELKNNYELVILSGDNDGEQEHLMRIFDRKVKMLFHQTPSDKLKVIRNLQAEGKNVLMVGDGLNDAGALKQSNAGISVSENLNNFSPACDAILDASEFSSLGRILNYARAGVNVIKWSFGISFLYNIVGVWFAVQGTLSPLIAAVLMPVSSVTVILFTTMMIEWKAGKLLKSE